MDNKQQNYGSHRIHAIDFIKGICILLVIFDHTRLVDPSSHKLYQMLDQIEVAGFFLVSGYLYHDDSSTRKWLTGKVRRLIIPFIFFGFLYALSDILYDPTKFVHEWKSYLFYLYLSPIYYPMWFVRALFWIMLIQRSIRHLPTWLQCGGVGCIIGLLILKGDIITSGTTNMLMLPLLRLNIASAMASFPFFWFGHILSRYKMLSFKFPEKVRWGLFTICFLFWYLFAKPDVHLHVPSSVSWTCLYISAISGCLAILLLAKDIPPIPLVNYFGKNSLIILGTHAILINIIRHTGIQSPAITTLCTIAATPLVIYLLKYLPWMIGEKGDKQHH